MIEGIRSEQSWDRSEMKNALKNFTKQLLAWGYSVQRRGKTQQKAILLGHMRCGSTLMVHILTSNPEIAGYGETHMDYRSVAELEKLSTNVYFTLRRLRPSRLVLDKVLHDEYILTDDILLAESCAFPIMAREAIASVRSMVTSLPGRFLKLHPNCTDVLTLAADYYRKRLDTLSRYAELLAQRGQCCYFTYEDLLERSAQVFRMLERCLELRHELSEQYAIGPLTGVHGYGDPSGNIKRGYIDRGIAREPMEIPQQLAEKLVEHFRSFDAHVRGLCKHKKEKGQ
jgi:hypothetical protein